MLAIVTSVVLALTSAQGAQGTASLKVVVEAYLQIQEALAADKIDGIKAPAQVIVEQAGAMGVPGAEMMAAAKAVGQAADLKAARDAFGPLSDAVIAATKGQDVGEVKLGFCPMVKRSWLQKGAKVRNPYYGSAMLECGELRDVKK